MTSVKRTVAVIGAGIAGLNCARKLHAADVAVTVFEKSRGLGGRVATRRLNSGVSFDHGAQYFTARDEMFLAQVNQWCAAGTAALWQGRIVSLNHGTCTELSGNENRYVGVPTMNAIAKSLATGLDVRTNTTVQTIRHSDGKWHLRDAAGTDFGPYDMLVSTAPPPQTLSLFGSCSPMLAETISKVTMAPCWAVMVQMHKPIELPFDAAFVNNSPLSWIARNSCKPKRDATDCWVLHASASWSRRHLEESPDAVAGALVEQFWEATRTTPQAPQLVAAHRWRYALPEEPLSERYVVDQRRTLGVCGDWCGGPRVEGAFLSGRALAESLLAAH
jgi:predicted NAD/FAD-dependent oxidoreductase